jgi:transcriptional regulator with XRE-family HTH domain
MNRIKQLREERGITQPELGRVLNVQGAAISKYENEKIPLTSDTIKTLASFFNVSSGYLLGETDEKQDKSRDITGNDTDKSSSEERDFYFFFDNEDLLRETFIARLKTAIADGGMSEKDFLCAVPIGSDRASALLNKEQDPSANDLIELSQFLNTSIDYLLGQIPAISFLEKTLLDTFVKLNEDNKYILVGKSKEILQNQRYEESVAAEDSLQEVK